VIEPITVEIAANVLNIDPLKSLINKSRAIAILGMHRSGTSTVARAINLMGVPLGEVEKMMPPNRGNSEGYWEHLEINDFQIRLMARLRRDWDAAEPLPEGWLQSEAVKPFKAELTKIIAANFGGRPIWAWKEPRSCVLLPLWREVLAAAQIELSCLFVVRNPVDVAGSLMRRDGIPFNRAVAIWFHYNMVALQDAAGLPVVFLSYEKLLAGWEPEMRRCVDALKLDWPADAQKYQTAMDTFIQPGLQHNRTSVNRLQELAPPVQELYQVLLAASRQRPANEAQFLATVERLSKDFQPYAPKLLHLLPGKKIYRSLCKRVVRAYDWLRP